MSRRRGVAGRHWLHAGKRKETVIGYLCSRGHYVFTADDPREDACQSKNVGTIVVRQLRSPGGWPEEQLDEFIADAERSLGEKLTTWRKCDCEGSAAYVKEVDDLLVSIEKRANAAEALLDSLADRVLEDARIRGDADMRSVEIAAAHIRNQVEGYKIHRDHGHAEADCPIAYPNGSALTFVEPRQGGRDIEGRIERSSLGTPVAKALRDSVSDEAVSKVMARVSELEAGHCEGHGAPGRWYCCQHPDAGWPCAEEGSE